MVHDPLDLAATGLADGFEAAAVGAALAAAPLVGSGRGDDIDGLAVRALRAALAPLAVDGVVVVGEGEKDEAPMLFVGERFGTGAGPVVDLAVDPVDGTRLAAAGRPGAMAVMAVAPGGALASLGAAHYMEKHVTWVPDVPAGASIVEIVGRAAAACGVSPAEVRVAVQDRPRNERFVAEARAAGASVELFEHGDVERCIRAARRGGGLDVVAGIGGAPEGVLTAAAVRALGGSMHARLAPQSTAERSRIVAAGLSETHVLSLDDLCGADAWLFVAAVTPCSFGSGAELAPGESWRVGPGDPGTRRPRDPGTRRLRDPGTRRLRAENRNLQ
ncbi:fructose-bisphosphatase class II family protein [Agromyces sp. SYSU K20354]|uniref:fructose-bisphosphatase class II n=1 Tax=Agromyces cavernae TaxID=2898659 RepID=UPI001E3681AB|nr:fructose-bisphosphatase class II [Agromyces cavernae]MCD2442737.1 fructose-bisphosphatase class II family protein [Agromyces cavernae]